MPLSKEQKKEAIRKYKEEVPPRGIFAVRCGESGRVWVGASRNLKAEQNRTWFTLRLGNHHERTLQEQWNTHGENAFRYEVLEKLDEDLPAIALPDVLKERKLHWATRLGASRLL